MFVELSILFESSVPPDSIKQLLIILTYVYALQKGQELEPLLLPNFFSLQGRVFYQLSSGQITWRCSVAWESFMTAVHEQEILSKMLSKLIV